MRAPPFAALSAGVLSSFVAFTSSFTVILQGLTAAGATPQQAASGLMILSIVMGCCGIVMSARLRMPIPIAWSTPGAALLASSGMPEGGFPVAVGAFLLAGVFVVASGLFRPLSRAIAAIPSSLANAMLAGILLALCLAPVRAVAESPAAGLAIAGTWLVVGQWRRLFAVPAAALVTVTIILWRHAGAAPLAGPIVPDLVFVRPEFTLASIVGIALPLFVVTMASQNIPGLAVLKVSGYAPSPAPLFTITGLSTLIAAPFGGHSVNLAAMTAAICAGDEAGPDRSQRWWAGIIGGIVYVLFGLTAGIVTAFAGEAPLLVQAMAGLALVGALSASAHAAMTDRAEREAATICFLVTASGTSFLGISAPFWGLVAGGVLLAVQRRRRAAVGRQL
ncbi:benzoate/H(+) symporter BenE family transporter [Aureimonas pseudogalii]|uniref:Benzoate membrane transport protein n=1 Tax=Aureimonas pseudogalii TaxID=1744844 RepID=A0A7W6EHD3_9HYPH|nr:benzoate/H(+) symporter BenE family transporter [Aureimonas pseudogalii]MBB3998159.1 benzoate membrane transport protein [Aureimonas pseudogalii]